MHPTVVETPKRKPAPQAGYSYALPALRETRQARGLTQQEVSDTSGLSKPDISRIEARKIRASQRAQGLFSDLYSSPIAELFEGHEPRPLDARDEDVERRYRAGPARYSDLALEFGIDGTHVGKILRGRGVPIRERTDPAIRAEAVRRYVAGEAAESIVAAGLGVKSVSSVLTWVRDAGEEVRPCAVPRKYPASEPRRCEECGEVFRPDSYRVDRGQGRFCSAACAKGGEEGRRNASTRAQARVARAQEACLARCKEDHLHTVKDVSLRLGVAENSITGRYVRDGLLPAIKVNFGGVTYLLIASDDLDAFERAWIAAAGSKLEWRLNYGDPEWVLKMASARGVDVAYARKRGLSIEETHDLIRARAIRRAKRYLRRRAGRPPALDKRIRYLGILQEALANDEFEPTSEYEFGTYISLVDYQRCPHAWPEEWKSPQDPESFGHVFQVPAADRVRKLIGPDLKEALKVKKALQNTGI